MRKNLNGLRLLCEEFGSAALRSKISAFQEGASVIDEEARRRFGGIEEHNMQQDRNLELQQRESAEKPSADSDLEKETPRFGEVNKISSPSEGKAGEGAKEDSPRIDRKIDVLSAEVTIDDVQKRTLPRGRRLCRRGGS
jgi:hypothetical protein